MFHISMFTGTCFSVLSALFTSMSTILSLKHRSIYYANLLSSLSNVSPILNSVGGLRMFYANLVQACLLIYEEEMVKIFFLSNSRFLLLGLLPLNALVNAHFSPTFFFKLEFMLLDINNAYTYRY